MYVWTGRQSPFHQRKVAMRLAREMWYRGYNYTSCDINPLSPLLSECTRGRLSVAKWILYGLGVIVL